MTVFNFDAAFSRNLGWLTEQEQAVLRLKRVAIAGLGGVGGVHLITLVRLGVGRFTLADFDSFELPNFNRQAGATTPNLGKPKTEAMAKAALEINPGLDIRLFPKGVTDENLDDFLKDADIYLDGLDFFELDMRRKIFRRCHELKIPAVTVAPVGMGAALLNFLPGGMTFDDYFQMDGRNPTDDLVRFLIGLSPRMLQMPYLADDTRADFKARRVPSTPMGCELAAGVAATEALKILLQRGDVVAAPRGIHFDAYRNLLVRTWRPWGNRHPIQKLAFRIAKRKLASKNAADVRDDSSKPLATPAERVIDLARWSPSGDNLQQWRFQLAGEREFLLFGDNHSRDVYFLNDWPKLLALGGLIETISIAATGEGLTAEFERPAANKDTDREIAYRVKLTESSTAASPLLPFIRSRTTQRRPFSKKPLSTADCEALEKSVAPYKVLWLDSTERRGKMASLASQYAKIRLTIPEAYGVHKKVIQWGARFSPDRIPDQAIGLDGSALKLMRWAMGSWSRVRFMNRFLAGTLMPRLQLEILPGRNCAAYAALLAPKPMNGMADTLEAGRMMQRFWLTATKLGLQFQPQMAPLIFDSYVREGIAFTTETSAIRSATSLSPKLKKLLGESNYPLVTFLARIGTGETPRSRSLRKSFSELTTQDLEK